MFVVQATVQVYYLLAKLGAYLCEEPYWQETYN